MCYEEERPAELPVEPKPPREVVERDEVLVERDELLDPARELVRVVWRDWLSPTLVGVRLVRVDQPGQNPPPMRPEREVVPVVVVVPELLNQRVRRHGCAAAAGALGVRAAGEPEMMTGAEPGTGTPPTPGAAAAGCAGAHSCRAGIMA